MKLLLLLLTLLFSNPLLAQDVRLGAFAYGETPLQIQRIMLSDEAWAHEKTNLPTEERPFLTVAYTSKEHHAVRVFIFQNDKLLISSVRFFMHPFIDPAPAERFADEYFVRVREGVWMDRPTHSVITQKREPEWLWYNIKPDPRFSEPE